MVKNINEIDKFKIIMPSYKIKKNLEKSQNFALGVNCKQNEKNTIIEVSSKIFSTPNDLSSINNSNIEQLPKILHDRINVSVDEYYLLNEAMIGIVHVKRDIHVNEKPNHYLSELKEIFKRNTDKYDVYRYGKLKYIDGLSLVPKAKSTKERYICYIKYAEMSQNKYDDFGYFNSFDYDYLQHLKQVIRFECQFSNFDAIRKAFFISEEEQPTISNVLACENDVVSCKFTNLLKIGKEI